MIVDAMPTDVLESSSLSGLLAGLAQDRLTEV